MIKGSDWTETKKEKTDGRYREYTTRKDGFSIPCDLEFWMNTLYKVEDYIYKIKRLGFNKEDWNFDFGLPGLSYSHIPEK